MNVNYSFIDICTNKSWVDAEEAANDDECRNTSSSSREISRLLNCYRSLEFSNCCRIFLPVSTKSSGRRLKNCISQVSDFPRRMLLSESFFVLFLFSNKSNCQGLRGAFTFQGRVSFVFVFWRSRSIRRLKSWRSWFQFKTKTQCNYAVSVCDKVWLSTICMKVKVKREACAWSDKLSEHKYSKLFWIWMSFCNTKYM